MPGDRLQRFSAVSLALLFGCLAEAILAGVNAIFGSAGHGGMNLVTLVVAIWHIPGMIVMALLPDSSARNLWGLAVMILVYVIGAFTFAAVFYLPIRRWKDARK